MQKELRAAGFDNCLDYVFAANLFILLASACFLFSCGGGSGSGIAPAAEVAPTATPTPESSIPPLVFKSLAGGFTNPVGLEMPNDGSNRFFIVEQGGTIKILHLDGTVPAQNFLDITAKVTAGGELGLLGVTFHPAFSTNGRFFVNYTRTVGGSQLQSVIAEYHVSSDPNLADPNSERILLTQNQPFPNHKAGQLAFGPDGFLYFGLGDGGSEGDPMGNGQNLETLLGKMMRIDVDHQDAGLQYAIPADNPFATSSTALHEIWAYGLRNPWRFSFERGTGRQFCADVGQDRFEEVDIIQKGGNFGWNVMEGDHCFNPPSGCDMTGKIRPISEYDHSQGSAVIGGYVYKGTQIPSLTNLYIFGDLSSGKIWYLREGPPGTFTQTLLLTVSFEVSSFGQDTAGEIYILDYSGGNVLKLSPQ
jgi:glucose/arabinose dehydrogenase